MLVSRLVISAIAGTVLLTSFASTVRPVYGEGRTVWDGLFSEAQAARGGVIHDDKCSGCHAKDLSGTGMAGELAGPTFRRNYGGTTIDDLYSRVRETMPADGPNTLGPQQYIDIVSYMLAKNDYPPGAADLAADPDVLKNIRLLAAKP
jgi:mono/diheme cytochrome c family protein